MKNLVIIGAGGMGREMYLHAMDCVGYGKEYRVKGFIDDNIHSLENYKGYPPVLSTIDEYEICNDDVFVGSIGNVQSKKRCIEKIVQKGGQFISLIHPSARIAIDATLGKGVIIMRRVDIGSYAIIGDYTFIQIDAAIGHDSSIGAFSRIDCKAVCVGGVKVMEESTIHTSAVISHHVTVGKRAIVGALSLVITDVMEDTTVVGNPVLTCIPHTFFKKKS